MSDAEYNVILENRFNAGLISLFDYIDDLHLWCKEFERDMRYFFNAGHISRFDYVARMNDFYGYKEKVTK